MPDKFSIEMMNRKLEAMQQNYQNAVTLEARIRWRREVRVIEEVLLEAGSASGSSVPSSSQSLSSGESPPSSEKRVDGAAYSRPIERLQKILDSNDAPAT